MNLTTTTIQTMTSREIAELTGKRHDHVMRDIRKMVEELGLPKLGESSYTNSQGKKQPQYVLDKDMTLTLISGYSAELRHRIIKRWRELEEQAQKALTPLDIMAQQIAYLQAMESRVQQVERQLEQISTATEYMTVVGWCRLKGRGSVDNATANAMGRKATAECKARGMKVGKTTHPIWGNVNTYPEIVMDDLFGGDQ